MEKQVFQTQTVLRWKSFLWLVRIVVVFLLIGSASIMISLFSKNRNDLKVLTNYGSKLPDLIADTTRNIISPAEQEAFADHLYQVRKNRKRSFYDESPVLLQAIKQFLPVKAAFYVNWDKQSSHSLNKNIGNLNMVLPEWIFQKDSKGNLEIQIDTITLNLLRKNNIAVLPMLTNNYNNQWNGDTTFLLLKNSSVRKGLIDKLLTILNKYKFQGINIDLESLPADAYPYLITFSEELYAAMHPAGYLTSVDVDPNDKNISFEKLAKFYDLIFLMAYDEHYPEGDPGSISSIGFIEKSLDYALKDIPSGKFVLCVAGYGYDWAEGKTGSDITYTDFVSLANEHKVSVIFNDSTSDLTVRYTDSDSIPHEAHCNDAAGIFNILRTSEDYEMAGVALWYIGSEDVRIWDYYSLDLNADSLNKKPFDHTQLETINSIYSISYDGSGEILEVLTEPKPGNVIIAYDTTDLLITEEEYLSLPASYLVKRYGNSDSRQIAITFDDGPDNEYTPQILDILKEKKVPATFFVTGINSENNIPLVKRVYNEGHEIGNHTFTHPNLENISDERVRLELRATRLLIESILGHSTLFFRPPYNTDSEPASISQLKPLVMAYDEGFVCVASSIDPNDWQPGVTSDTIVARAIAQQFSGNIMLLHDAGGERSQTLKALPRIIDIYKEQGYEFVPVSALMGKTRDEIMPAVRGKLEYSEFLDNSLFTVTFIWEHFLHGFFIVAILLMSFRLLAIAFMAIMQHRNERKNNTRNKNISSEYNPSVSIIVPAYNEEVNAVQNVIHLLQSDYPGFEIVFVDDGSKDNTYLKVKEAFLHNSKVKVLAKPNGGKATALNFGIKHAAGEILVCIDADTMLTTDAVSKMIPYFEDPQIGGVAGNVRVGNTLNILTNWQSLEYTTSQNFDRRAFDYIDAISVIPGAIGAFRKEAVEKIGGFATDTLAEDCDLTFRLHREGYKIRSCNDALALTEAPETIKMFLKQRFRWSFGMMQSFWKHRDMLFSFRKINIGWVLLPNLLIFNFIIPLFSPLVDIMFIAGLFTRHALTYTLFYFLYFIIDSLISSLAFGFDRQKFTARKVIFLFIQRFIYRQLLFYVLLKAYLNAIKGEMASWGVLKRTGNVKN
jgi:poly-beta-1,6 N-acetyl-D-glucosamine synthase